MLSATAQITPGHQPDRMQHASMQSDHMAALPSTGSHQHYLDAEQEPQKQPAAVQRQRQRQRQGRALEQLYAAYLLSHSALLSQGGCRPDSYDTEIAMLAVRMSTCLPEHTFRQAHTHLASCRSR